MQYQGGWPADQSGLTKIAERLVEAALRHGADAADAVAVRGISQSIDVRDGSVEESQRSEGDNVGLRAFVGRRQAVVSTNDLSGQGADAIAERVVAMARAAPEDRFAGLADPKSLARDLPDLDLLDGAPRPPSLASPSPAAPRPRPASAAWCW
jgi:PmbA protein